MQKQGSHFGEKALLYFIILFNYWKLFLQRLIDSRKTQIGKRDERRSRDRHFGIVIVLIIETRALNTPTALNQVYLYSVLFLSNRIFLADLENRAP